MKSVLMSINSIHNVNIEKGLKTSELRTLPPKLDPPFKVYVYESGPLGRHKVVSEWICSDMITWRMCVGIPAHLVKDACVSSDYIWKYSNGGYKNITEMKISELVIYDKPKDLSDFYKRCYSGCDTCNYSSSSYSYGGGRELVCTVSNKKPIKKAPQNWCYVDC